MLQLLLGLFFFFVAEILEALRAVAFLVNVCLGQLALRIFGDMCHRFIVELISVSLELVDMVVVDLQLFVLDQVTSAKEQSQANNASSKQEQRSNFGSIEHRLELQKKRLVSSIRERAAGRLTGPGLSFILLADVEKWVVLVFAVLLMGLADAVAR